MPRYMSHRHRRLMDESEQALWNAITDKPRRQSSIAKHILNDPKSHLMWEVKHAELLRPVAQQRKRAPQLLALREIEVRLVHRRALIDHIRNNKLRAQERDKMFAAIYGPKDVIDAILIEHRQYMMAVSSYLSTDHLIGVMYDPIGKALLRTYERLYDNYFELYGQVVRSQDAILANATKPLMLDARERLAVVRQRIRSERLENSYADFDRQALLARSGRQPVLDYMVV